MTPDTPAPTRRRRFSSGYKAVAVARVAAGATVREVADDVGVSAPTLHGWVKRNGRPRKIPSRSASPPATRRRATSMEKEAVLADLAAGMSWNDISARHGVVHSTIYRWAKRSGRFLFGELAPRVGDDPALPEAGGWWSDILGVDDRTAAIAVAALEAGVTRRRLIEATGWTRSCAEIFVRHGRARRGLPGLIPGKAPNAHLPSQVDDIVDWSNPPITSADFDVDVAVSVLGPKKRRRRARSDHGLALARLDAGERMVDVAFDLDVSVQTLRNWKIHRDRKGYVPSVVGRRRVVPKLSIEGKVAAVKEFSAGMTYAQIAARHGVEVGTVRTVVLGARNRAKRLERMSAGADAEAMGEASLPSCP